MSLLKDAIRSSQKGLSNELERGKWFDELVKRSKDYLNSVEEDSEDSELRNGALAALGKLEQRRNDVIDMGQESLSLFVAHMAGGNSHEAKLEYIRATASPDDLIQGMLDDAGIVAREKRAREQLADQALDLIEDITFTGARFLLPLLIL